MSAQLEALKYILSKASLNVDGLKYYMDGTKYIIREHETAKNLIDIARDIVEEMITP
jgi:hypothetical protein